MDMDEKQIETWINQIIREEQKLPEGLSERLEQYIDELAAQPCPAKEKRAPDAKRRHMPAQPSIRLWLYGLSGIVAVALLCLGLFKTTYTAPPSRLADTYTNPRQAAEVAAQALTFMSANLNKGLHEVDRANREWTEINGILNNYLNE